ncbi:MAG: crosslink repair DNA glycosylase YcaQ family protein [Leifsonia sp.]
MQPHRLSRTDARRIAVMAQLLDAPRPTDLLHVVRHLAMLQIDPTAAIAPNADLVAWSRLGSAYRPEDLTHALEEERSLIELDALIRPVEDLALYRADMAAWPRYERHRVWMKENEPFRRDVIERLRATGAVTSREIPDTSIVPWPSSGWTNNRNVTQMLEFLMMRGEVAIAGRRGRERIWDIAERVYPAETSVIPSEEAERLRNERRLRALGIARAKTTVFPIEPGDVGEAGEPAVVDGVPGEWRVDPDLLARPFTGRTALLSPFDRLVHNRTRVQELFEFEYTLEMYKPAAKRRWGYFALPILHDDRLVGKLDAKADRRAAVLAVDAVHEDIPFTKRMRHDVDDEIHDLAGWLGLEAVFRA